MNIILRLLGVSRLQYFGENSCDDRTGIKPPMNPSMQATISSWIIEMGTQA